MPDGFVPENHFVWCHGSIKSHDTAIHESDRPYELPLSDETKRMLREAVLWYFAPNVGTCPVIPFQEIDFNEDSVAGVKYPKIHKKKMKKGDVLRIYSADFLQYWVHAYKMNWRTYYKVSMKQELLKRAKVDEHKTRLFMIEDVVSFASNARLYQAQNKAITGRPPFMVGCTPFYGGLNEMIRNAEDHFPEGYYVWEGDYKWYDKTEPGEDMLEIHLIRTQFYDGSTISHDEYIDRSFHAYKNAIFKLVVCVDGIVLEFQAVNPSGWENTTVDNCLRHLRICIYHFTRVTGLPFTYMSKYVLLHLYGDDHLNFVSKLCPCVKDLISYDERYKSALPFGGILKKEDDRVWEDTVVGAKWLGATILRARGAYVGVYDKTKMLCSAAFYDGLDDEQEFCKIISLCLLMAFEDDAFQRLHLYAIELGRHIGRQPPPRAVFYTLWTGEECPVPVTPFLWDSKRQSRTPRVSDFFPVGYEPMVWAEK